MKPTLIPLCSQDNLLHPDRFVINHPARQNLFLNCNILSYSRLRSTGRRCSRKFVSINRVPIKRNRLYYLFIDELVHKLIILFVLGLNQELCGTSISQSPISTPLSTPGQSPQASPHHSPCPSPTLHPLNPHSTPTGLLIY